MKRRLATGVLLAAAGLLLAGCFPQEQFLERAVLVDGNTYRYRVWLPPHYVRFVRWPVILYLHGTAERGDDDVRPLTTALPTLLVRTPGRYPAIVVIPQCRPGQEWVGPMETQALAALEASIREFHGDRRRVYLTGVSMGGAGVWYFARHPHLFAAIVPVSGEVVRQSDDPWPVAPPADLAALLATKDPYGALARAIGGTPAWVFHGSDDDVIPVSEARKMVAALLATGDVVRYTEYQGAGHPVDEAAYAEPGLPKWLFERELPAVHSRRNPAR